MSDRLEDLAHAFEKFPGIGPRQARRFVYHLLSSSQGERNTLSNLISTLTRDITQCSSCMRYAHFNGNVCGYCADTSRDETLLMLVEKDQDLLAIEKTGVYRGRYFVLGGTITLSGKGSVRERELLRKVKEGEEKGLQEVVIALSATSEGEHTALKIIQLLREGYPTLKLSILGRGLATGSELEYADSPTLTGALLNRKET